MPILVSLFVGAVFGLLTHSIWAALVASLATLLCFVSGAFRLITGLFFLGVCGILGWILWGSLQRNIEAQASIRPVSQVVTPAPTPLPTFATPAPAPPRVEWPAVAAQTPSPHWHPNPDQIKREMQRVPGTRYVQQNSTDNREPSLTGLLYPDGTFIAD